jgi:hypothetical protein
MPSENYNYNVYSGDLDSVVGVALNGVPFFTGTSEIGSDAYFPKSTDLYYYAAIDPDSCLGSSDYDSYYHYYSYSPCILFSKAKNVSSGSMCYDIKSCYTNKLTYAFGFISAKNKGLTAIGIARDGHKIYGPYNSKGELW